MSTLQLTQMSVVDPDALRAHRAKAEAIVEAHGGRLRALSVGEQGRVVVEGTWDPDVVMSVHEWPPDRSSFEAFYASPNI